MRPVRHAVLAACLLAAAGCWAASPPVPDTESDDDEPISLPDSGDRVSPESLAQRLAYAQAQLDSDEGDCSTRLDAAQAQRDIVVAHPALDVFLPAGRARLGNIDYRLHLARAYCGSGNLPRREELQASLDAASRAVSLYRGLHDYQSMAVMQYDVAAVHRLMGDAKEAVAALEAALAMDRDYGFGPDAEDNAKILARWTEQPPPSDTGAPHRSVTLKFAWGASDADVAVDADYLDLAGGEVVHSKAATVLARHIRPDADGWILSSEPGDRRYDFEGWAGRGSVPQEESTLLSAAERLWPAAVKIGALGAFKGIEDPNPLAGTLNGDIQTVKERLAMPSAGKPTSAEELRHTVELLAKPDGMSAAAGQEHALFTAAWIDATLEQGVWYETTASLLLPGMVILADQDIQFAYSRPVPCGASPSDEPACAEILVHVTPEPESLTDKLALLRQSLKLTGTRKVHYTGVTDLRLVVEPGRLLPHVSELRRHWYIEVDGKGPPIAGAETIVSTYSYH